MLDFFINSINLLATKCTLFSESEYEFIHNVYLFLLYATPAVVLALCTVDIANAVIAQDDNAVKKAMNKAIKRLIAGVIMFFIPVFLNLLIGAVSGDIDLGGACVDEISKE